MNPDITQPWLTYTSAPHTHVQWKCSRNNLKTLFSSPIMICNLPLTCSPCAEGLWRSGCYWEKEFFPAVCPSGCSPAGPDADIPGDRCSCSLRKMNTHESERPAHRGEQKKSVKSSVAHTPLWYHLLASIMLISRLYVCQSEMMNSDWIKYEQTHNTAFTRLTTSLWWPMQHSHPQAIRMHKQTLTNHTCQHMFVRPGT